MNWFSFAIAAWISFGLEVGVRDMFSLRPWSPAPSFVVALLVFIAMHASQRAVLWAALILGVLVDLTGSITLQTGGSAVLLGPNAIGFLLGAQIVLALRGMIVSRNPLSMGVLAIAVSAISQIVVIAFLTIHKVYSDPVVWNAGERLLDALLSAVYTGAAATILSFIFIPLTPLFAFAHVTRRFGHP